VGDRGKSVRPDRDSPVEEKNGINARVPHVISSSVLVGDADQARPIQFPMGYSFCGGRGKNGSAEPLLRKHLDLVMIATFTGVFPSRCREITPISFVSSAVSIVDSNRPGYSGRLRRNSVVL